jgi:hypothetical protein
MGQRLYPPCVFLFFFRVVSFVWFASNPSEEKHQKQIASANPFTGRCFGNYSRVPSAESATG